MKTEKREATGRLLNDLLADELEGLGDGRKAIALAAFRRAHLVRRVRNSAGLVVVLAALAAALFHYSRPRQTQLIAETAPAATAPIPAGTAYSGDTLVKISDAELIASFPADTCFLAEVDGRKILVFTDPALRDKYLHRPTDKTASGSF